MKVKNKGWFIDVRKIREIWTAKSSKRPYEEEKTVFYKDHNNRNKDVTFFFNLN